MTSYKDKSHKVGSDIGRWLSIKGEDYDFKDLDQLGHELLEDIEIRREATNSEAFREGIASGYMLQERLDEMKDDPQPPLNRLVACGDD